MNAAEMRAVLATIEYLDYRFVIVGTEERPELMAQYELADIITGATETQTTRKWHVSIHATKSELVQTAFKCCLTSAEHRCREDFKYRNRRVFGPHFDVDALHQLCSDRKFDIRPDATKDV
jgi:hypothetical protein